MGNPMGIVNMVDAVQFTLAMRTGSNIIDRRTTLMWEFKKGKRQHARMVTRRHVFITAGVPHKTTRGPVMALLTFAHTILGTAHWSLHATRIQIVQKVYMIAYKMTMTLSEGAQFSQQLKILKSQQLLPIQMMMKLQYQLRWQRIQSRKL